jgi:hypothetical protein
MSEQRKVRQTRILERILATTSAHITDYLKLLDDLRSMASFAKTPHDRTSLNIILDDQRKVIKSLKRLQADVSEMLD